RLHFSQRRAIERLALLEQAAHFARLTIEQRIFATLRIAFVKYRYHAIVGTALDDGDVARSVPGQVRQILRRAGIDDMPAGTISIRSRGDRTTLVVEGDLHNIG